MSSLSFSSQQAVGPGPREALHRAAAVAWSASLLAVGFLLGFREIFDLDIFYHIATGREILARGGIPTENVLTFPASDRPFYPNPAWLFEVVAALVDRSAGVAGLVAGKAVMVVLLFWVMFRVLRAGKVPAWQAAPLISLFGMGAAFRFSVRPHLVSLVFFALCILLALRHRRRGGKDVWWLPVLFALWANIHAGFILGLGYLYLFLASEWLGQRLPGAAGALPASGAKSSARGLLLPVAGATLAVFAAPYPLSNFVFLADLLVPRILPITEYLPPGLKEHVWFYGLVAGFLVLLALRRLCPRDPALLLPAVVFLLLALKSQRFVPYFGMAALPWLAETLRSWHAGIQGSATAAGGRKVAAASLSLVLAVSLPTLVLLWPPTATRFGIGWERSSVPMAAMNFLQSIEVAGNLYNSQNYGGLGAYFFGSRRQVFQTCYYQAERDVIEEAYLACRSPESWQEFLDSHRIEIALVDTTREPHSPLFYSPEAWALIYFDDFTAVFVRRSEANREVIREHEYRVADPSRFFSGRGGGLGIDLDRLQEGVAEMRRALALNPENALAHLILGSYLAQRDDSRDEALEHFEAAVRLEPDIPAAHFQRAWLLAQEQRHAEASRAMERYLALMPQDVEGYIQLAGIHAGTGALEKGIEVLEMAAERFPDQGVILVSLGDFQLRAGQTEAALKSLRLARERMPEDPEVMNLLGVALSSQGKVEEALTYFRRALALQPTYLPARKNFEKARQMTERQKR